MVTFYQNETFTGTIQLTSGYFGTASNVIATPFTYDVETVTFDNLVNATVVFDANGDFNNDTETLGVSVNGDLNGTFFNKTAADNGDFEYVAGSSSDYLPLEDSIPTGWDYIEINGNRGYPNDDTLYGGSQYDPAAFDPVTDVDGITIIANTADMEFDTQSPQFQATFDTLSSLTFDVDPTDSGDINFGVDAAEINYTVTAETGSEVGAGAISNVVAYLDCTGDGELDTKIKFDGFDEVDCDGDGEPDELYELSLDQLYEALGKTEDYADCIILGVTIKAGNNDGGFGPGEGEFIDVVGGDDLEDGTPDKADDEFDAAHFDFADIWC